MSQLTELIDKVKTSTNLKEAVEGAKQILPHFVLSVQQMSQQIEDAGGEGLTGEEKKALVIKTAQETFTPFLNKYLNIPFLKSMVGSAAAEELEAKIINNGIAVFIGKTIDKTVAVLKKGNWQIN